MLVFGPAIAWATPDLNAVGRLNRGGRGFCTATLIAPDKVLTAAHCVLRPSENSVLPLNDLHFVAGWDRGDFVAHAQPSAVAFPDDYPLGDRNDQRALRWDVAVLTLAEPIPESMVTPLPVARRMPVENAFATHQYYRRVPHSLRQQTACVVERQAASLWLSDCLAAAGASGAPYLTLEGEVAGVVVGRETSETENPLTGEGRAIIVPLRPALVDALSLDRAAAAGGAGAPPASASEE